MSWACVSELDPPQPASINAGQTAIANNQLVGFVKRILKLFHSIIRPWWFRQVSDGEPAGARPCRSAEPVGPPGGIGPRRRPPGERARGCPRGRRDDCARVRLLAARPPVV